jgi:hypothetical protein
VRRGRGWKSDVSSGSHPRAADTEGQFRPSVRQGRQAGTARTNASAEREATNRPQQQATKPTGDAGEGDVR